MNISAGGNVDVGGDVTGGDKVTNQIPPENRDEIKKLVELFEQNKTEKSGKSLADGIISLVPGVATKIITEALLSGPGMIMKFLK